MILTISFSDAGSKVVSENWHGGSRFTTAGGRLTGGGLADSAFMSSLIVFILPTK